ncbi:MAG TPA: hypothetical protein VE733_01010 [Streptosporangiaceae bacterium]|jgi:hypothetical protein|nr:hypothetical protein [Streptosporangiaceae bacterium]
MPDVTVAIIGTHDTIVQRKMKGTVWVTGGCKSWYLDSQGCNVTLWPDDTWVYAVADPPVRRGQLRHRHRVTQGERRHTSLSFL